MTPTVIIIGVGFMGKMQASVWKQKGYDVVLCDVAPTSEVWVTTDGVMKPVLWDREAIADSIGARFIQLPAKWSEQEKMLSAIQADCWNIASPTQYHYQHLTLAHRLGIPKILLEKPVTLSKEEMHLIQSEILPHTQSLIQVNYIERANHVVLHAHTLLSANNWIPRRGLFWRQHDMRDYQIAGAAPADHTWGLLRDLSHDVSEVHAFTQTLKINTAQLHIPRAQLTPWSNKYHDGALCLPSDVASDFSLCSQEFEWEIRGAKDNPREKRFFILYDEERLLYGTTLYRPNLGISPCLFSLEGAQSVLEVVTQAYGNYPHRELPQDRESLQALFTQLGGKELDVGNSNPQLTMVDNLLTARTEDDLLCSLKSALEIDSLVEEAYVVGGMPLPSALA